MGTESGQTFQRYNCRNVVLYLTSGKHSLHNYLHAWHFAIDGNIKSLYEHHRKDLVRFYYIFCLGIYCD